MAPPRPLILLTRPARQAAAFRMLLGDAVEVIESPLLQIRPLPVSVDVAEYDVLIFTSQNAVAAVSKISALAAGLRGKRAYAVGDKTAAAAKQLGMTVLSSGGDANTLVDAILGARPAGKILFFRGRHTTGLVHDRLKNSGLETHSIICYEQEALSLTRQAKHELRKGRPILVPLFSPRTAQIFFEEIGKIEVNAPLTIVALSEAVLAAVTNLDNFSHFVTLRPTAESMAIELLRRIGEAP